MPAPRHTFTNPEPLGRPEALAALASDDVDEVQNALVAVALHEEDGRWIEEQCWRLANHPDVGVRGTAGLCLGHVGRRFGVVDERSWELVRHLCDDPEVDNRPCDALTDLETYVDRDAR